MNNSQFEALKKKMESNAEEVAQNKGRFSQLKETAKKKFGVDSIDGLKKLKTEKDEEMDMQKTKRAKQMQQLEAIVPASVMTELLEENPDAV